MKRGKVARVQVSNLLELKTFCLPFTIPETLEMLRLPNQVDAAPPQIEGDTTANDEMPNTPAVPKPMPMPNPLAAQAGSASDKGMMYVPMDNLAFGVDGALFTGRVQMHWLQQLMKMRNGFVLHADGKHKLHHGKWILMTLGTHHLRWDEQNGTLSTQFVPLVYLFCLQHESDGACLMLVRGVKLLAGWFFPEEVLEPGACMSDHSSAFRNAYEEVFPDSMFGQCWPHISRKWAEGEYCSKKWEHFNTVAVHIREIHFARSAGMRDLLTQGFGELWDQWGKQMNTFWNSYIIDGWDNWTLGLFEARLCTPSQQAQESWHKLLLRTRIPSMFKGSTEFVFQESLPQLIQMDGLALPNSLRFSVPAIPKDMMKKALWYIENQTTHVHAARDAQAEVGFYFLRKAHELTGVTKITKKLVEMYECALEGERDRRIQDFDHLREVCSSLHFVHVPLDVWGCIPCYGNPAGYVCDCKGCKGYGICSHVLAINHILKHFNVRTQLATIGKSNRAKSGGRPPKPEPALQRARIAREPDSSDEEAERNLELGRQGK